MIKQSCIRCIYDETIPMIHFDSNGICNYCHQYEEMDKQYPKGEAGKQILNSIVEKIKIDGRKNKYDVVIGVSGGCDSSFMLHLAKQYSLRPLAVHFNNTWNSHIANENIQVMTKILNIDLFTIKVDDNEYNDIFKSFFKASVPEIDTPSDIGLAATHYIAAAKYGIKYIWEGHSFRTEGISPMGWFYMDAKYIDSIQKIFGTKKIKTLPNLWLGKWMRWMILDKIKKMRPLYYYDYDKEEIKKMLHEKYGWQWYGGHHMENKTAYFANNYYLPKKFNIDLRYCELSALVRSGQMTRDAALFEIKKEKQFSMDILDEIKNKLHFSNFEFSEIMNAPVKSYRDFNTYKQVFEKLKPVFWLLYKFNLVTKSFYVKYTNKDEKKGN
ncbi:MAG: N-acetyl sugar amidotransferase [Methanobrevibacter sp.]|nr:N-acetyl sugar amidotransferase [Methanobrevibacter sp.]